MTPIERAARALCALAGVDPNSTCDVHMPGDPDAIFAWAGFRPQVRTVLQAIREPSEAMMVAGECAPPEATAIWRAMIDAALKDEGA